MYCGERTRTRVAQAGKGRGKQVWARTGSVRGCGLGGIAEPRALAYVAKQRGVPSVAVLGASAAVERHADADQCLDLTQVDFAAGISELRAMLPPSIARR